jgi:tetratricopeptide (TPR) repeat protein
MNNKWTHIILMISIAVVCILIFYKLTVFDFVADDWNLIQEKKDFLQNWNNIGTVFTQPFPATTYAPIPFYRPIIILVNMMNNYLLGKSIFGFHIINLGFHILNAILIYLLLFVLFKRELLSFLAALFFAAHPIHSISVVWISARTDLIACSFVLLCLILFYKSRDHSGPPRILMFWGSILAYLLALFSKEMVLALPLFLLVWEFVSYRASLNRELVDREKPEYLVIVPFFAAAVLYLIARIMVLGNLGTGGDFTTASLFQRFLTMFSIYFYYFKKLIFPFYLNFSPRVLTITSIISLKFWGTLIVFAVITAFGISMRRKSQETSFGILWILVTLIPVLNLVPLYASVKEWWAYIPSIGFCLVLGRVVEIAIGWERKLLEIRLRRSASQTEESSTTESGEIPELPTDTGADGITPNKEGEAAGGEKIKKKKLFRLPEAIVIRAGHVLSLIFAIILLFYGFNIQSEARILRKDYFLWRETSKVAPYDSEAHRNFSKILQRKNVLRWAKEASQRAVQADPNSALARNQFGMMLEMSQENDSAMIQIKEAIRLNPEFADAYNNLGILYGKRGDYDSSLVAFNKAIEFDSTFFQPWKNIALIHYELENYPEALKCFKNALRLANNRQQAEDIENYIQQLRVEGWGQ